MYKSVGSATSVPPNAAILRRGRGLLRRVQSTGGTGNNPGLRPSPARNAVTISLSHPWQRATPIQSEWRRSSSAAPAAIGDCGPCYSRKLHQTGEIDGILAARTASSAASLERPKRRSGGAHRFRVRTDRRHEDQVANAGGLRGTCQFGGRQAVDSVIGLLGNLRRGVRDPGEVNHRLDTIEQRAPFDPAPQIRYRNHLDRPRECVRRLPHRRSHGMYRVGQFGDQGASDEAGCAGHKYARHDLPRAKFHNSEPTRVVPPPSATTALHGPGHNTLAAASATSRRLTANTRATISETLHPRSVASW